MTDPTTGIICHLSPGKTCRRCGAIGATEQQAGNGHNDTWTGDPLPYCGRHREALAFADREAARYGMLNPVATR